ncbi:hypothetical protein [Bremerella alba]|nr:hypothetical protein [Bremerella alba]
MKRVSSLFLSVVLLSSSFALADEPQVLQQDNLVAWCIVPFDAAKRTPPERAAMLKELGIQRCAYDWRTEHVPTFEAEIQAYQQEGIEFFAFWRVHDQAFELFKKYDLHPQIWETIPLTDADTQEARVEQAAQRLQAVAKRTQHAGFPLGLYNHGGWGGEPENMVAVCQKLRSMGFDHVGIVYNFHHGHEHIADWPVVFGLMKPYLICLNLNGMNDKAKPKILGIGKGKHERAMIETIVESGYNGPIGILDHRNELDAKESLQENLTGLATVVKELPTETK